VAVIRTRTTDDVCTIILERPERRNALRPADLDDIESAVETTDAPVVLLRGEGAAFCAGADLDVIATLDGEAAAAFARQGQRVARTLADPETITIAGIDGPARGGGVELAVACDLRIATPGATLAEPGVSMGLFGAWGGTARLPRIVGLGVAMDLALTGRVLDAQEAHRLGLVSQITDDPRAVAQSIATHDSEVLRTITTRLRDSTSRSQQEAREAEAFARLAETTAPDDWR
jgi:Enoyl-CoA hydratase/carnithine racemase